MDVFVAGGTGVLGRAALQPLVQAGHRVRSSARGKEKSDLIRSLGAEPVDVDLYDPASLREAIAGCGAVLRLTTRIPALMKMRNGNAWLETNRLRTEGARLLVDAAIAEHVSIYVHESVAFVYRDGGTGWLTEDAPTDDGGKAILRAALFELRWTRNCSPLWGVLRPRRTVHTRNHQPGKKTHAFQGGRCGELLLIDLRR